MKCSKCGAEVPETAAFCSQCGQPLGAGAAQADPASAGQGQEAGQQPSMAEQLQAAVPAAEEGQEKVLWQGRYSGKAMAGVWFGCLLATIVLPVAVAAVEQLRQQSAAWITAGVLIALLWGVTLARLAYKKLGIRYELTDRKFVHAAGILMRDTDRIELYEIQDVTCRQSLFQRIFNVGSVKIISGDETHPEFTLEGISDPQKVADMIDNVRRPLREKRMLIRE